MATPPTVHATAAIVGTAGILIRGRSGAGKSTLAHALVAEARAAGRFAAFVADDRVVLSVAGGRLVARVPTATAGLAELAGHGIVETAHEPAAVVVLVVDLVAPDAVSRMPVEGDQTVLVEGVPVSRLAVPERSLEVARLLVAAALSRSTLSARSALAVAAAHIAS